MMRIQIKKSCWKWFLIPLFVLIALCMVGLLRMYTNTDKNLLYLTPTFQDAYGWSLYTLDMDGTHSELTPRDVLDVEPFETFYISRTIPAEWENDGYSFLLLNSQSPSSVFLDGELLYSTCPSAGQIIGQISFPKTFLGSVQRGESIRISLPNGSVGKVITIATAHFNKEYSPSLPSIRLSSEAIEAALWMSAANYSTMPATAFAVAALLLLGLLCYSLFNGSRNVSLLLLSATAFCYLFYYLRQYSFSSPSLTQLDTPLMAFIPMLAILLPELYLLLQMKRHRKLCTIFVLSSGALSLIPPVANLFGSPSFSTTPFVELLYIGLIAVLMFAILEAKNNNNFFRLFLYGWISICASVLIGYFISSTSNAFFADYISSLLSQVFHHDPYLFLHWCGMLLFMIVFALSVYQIIRNTADTQSELTMQSERVARLDYELAIQKEIYETKLTNEEELRALRHDIKGHLFTLSELLLDHKTEEATAYVSRLTKQHQKQQSEIFSNNPYMNAVLRVYHLRFKEHNIPFDCLAGVDSRALPGVELCLILNNALENALEASLLLPETDRLVKLQARIWHGQLLIRIRNHFNGILNTHNNLPVTSKKTKGHGYGMTNILSTVQRLGGDMNYQIVDRCFVLDVRFPLQEQDNN